MKTLRERMWLWGQSPDAHYTPDNMYKLEKHSRMTAVEGCHYFDIPNICRVRMQNHPLPPYDQESEAMRSCREVVWSFLGAGGEVDDSSWRDIDEVIRQADMYPNISGGIFDDFFNDKRREYYTPEKLREIKARIAERAGRHLDMWVVCYEHDFARVPNLAEYCEIFDVLTFWTWRGSELPRAEGNIRRLHALAPEKRILAGMYMYNYGERLQFSGEDMKYQAELYTRLIREGVLDGIVLCSNCIADLGFPAVEWTRNWLLESGDMLL